MSDERLERVLSDAITDLAGSSEPDYLNDILERTSRTRQRPWWTFPKRYFSMSSTLKFATAASLAFVLGIGIAPLVVPSDQSGSGGPSAAQSPSPAPDPSEASPAVEFAGHWEAVSQIPSDIELVRDQYPSGSRGNLWKFRTVEMSDPRLDGDVVVSQNTDNYTDIGVNVYHAAFRIDNEGGAWVEQPGLAMQFPGDVTTATTAVMVGTGDYDGLLAIIEIDWLSSGSGLFDIRGIVVNGDVPPVPAPAPAPGTSE